MKTIMSEKAVCKWLGISESYLKDLRRNKGFPSYAITREFHLYNKQDIIDWVTGRQTVEYELVPPQFP